MASVADCLKQHAPAYLDKFGQRMPLMHRKVISAITRCRTGQLGGILYECDGCGRRHWVGRSCGNRHCPTCQVEKTSVWLEKQTARLLPVHHFLVTFTVPQELRPVLRANQKDGYDAVFQAGRGTLQSLATNERWLGTSKLGFFGVLHTWGRDPMVYHPHVHFVVPGGGVSEDGTKWLATAENFLFPGKAVSTVYKAKFADAMREADLYDSIPAAAWKKRWTVDMKPVGNGHAVLKYLAPYVYRVAISDKRIESCDEQSVTYRYTPTGETRSKTRTVTGQKFVRGFVQHVLPRGFGHRPKVGRVRYYGWMSPNNKVGLDNVRWLVWLFLGWTYWLASAHVPQDKPATKKPVRCAACGDLMRIIAIVYENCRVLVEHSLPYLDSG